MTLNSLFFLFLLPGRFSLFQDVVQLIADNSFRPLVCFRVGIVIPPIFQPVVRVVYLPDYALFVLLRSVGCAFEFFLQTNHLSKKFVALFCHLAQAVLQAFCPGVVTFRAVVLLPVASAPVALPFGAVLPAPAAAVGSPPFLPPLRGCGGSPVRRLVWE